MFAESGNYDLRVLCERTVNLTHFGTGRSAAMFKMSDWEDEYDENGDAILKPPPQACRTGPGPPPHSQYHRETEFHGRSNFAGPRVDGAAPGREVVRHAGGDDWGPPARQAGRRMFRDASESDRRPPVVTLTVDSAKVGRVIGKFSKLSSLCTFFFFQK